MSSSASRRELTDADIAMLRVRALEFADSDLWRTMVEIELLTEQRRIMGDLTDRATPPDQLKFAQGELAQVNRDILLVDRFIAALAGEHERRMRAAERRG